MKKICNNRDYCYIRMPNESEKIIKIQPFRCVPFVIYAGLESWFEKMY